MIEEAAAAARHAARGAGLALGPAQGPARRARRASSSTSTAGDEPHLVLVGPDVTAVADDPEGAEVLAEVEAAWRDAARAPIRRRVHLALLPMEDADENAVIVNALQRRADVVVQKSLAEGFGLTVAEAMWKGRPVVASRVGGIQDQIEDGRDRLPGRRRTTSPRSASAWARCSPIRTTPSGWARRRRPACATSSSARAISASTSSCSSASSIRRGRGGAPARMAASGCSVRNATMPRAGRGAR